LLDAVEDLEDDVSDFGIRRFATNHVVILAGRGVVIDHAEGSVHGVDAAVEIFATARFGLVESRNKEIDALRLIVEVNAKVDILIDGSRGIGNIEIGEFMAEGIVPIQLFLVSSSKDGFNRLGILDLGGIDVRVAHLLGHAESVTHLSTLGDVGDESLGSSRTGSMPGLPQKSILLNVSREVLNLLGIHRG
jgi:hypothetical protein